MVGEMRYANKGYMFGGVFFFPFGMNYDQLVGVMEESYGYECTRIIGGEGRER